MVTPGIHRVHKCTYVPTYQPTTPPHHKIPVYTYRNHHPRKHQLTTLVSTTIFISITKPLSDLGLRFAHQKRMSSGKGKKRFQELLEVPFRHKKSRSSSPSTTPRPALSSTTSNTIIPTNAMLRSLVGASASTSIGTASSSTLAGPAYATRHQSLNPQSSPTSTLVKNDSFQKAIQEYIHNLSDDDKVAFQSATDVMEELGKLQQGGLRIPTSHSTWIQKVQKVLQCMKQFLGSVAICVQHSPQISSLVVGGLHCILTVSRCLLY